MPFLKYGRIPTNRARDLQWSKSMGDANTDDGIR
jgi:hypothetical protein